MSWAEAWERQNPERVLERKQEQQRGRPSAGVALARIERLFAGEDMAREMDFRVRIGTPMHNRLENWGWVMSSSPSWGGGSPTAEICRLLQIKAGKYKPEKGSEPPDRAQIADAAEIEHAWRLIEPKKAKMFLSGYYVYRLHPNALCRAAATRYADFDSSMANACNFLTTMMERLAFRKESAHNPAYNLTSDMH